MVLRSRVVGTGSSLPDRVVTNADMTQWMDTSDEWIEQRTGIRERRWVEEGQRPSDLARGATLDALEDAGLEVSDIDCILLATLSGEHDFLIVAGRYQRVLVVGCEVHSTGLDKSTAGRDVTVIFGDGSGAVVLEGTDSIDGPGVLEVRVHSQGKHARRLWVEAPSSAIPGRISHEMIDDRRIFPYMDGRFVFKHAVTRMPEILCETLDAAGVKLGDIDLFLFHQANLRINEYVAQKLEIPEAKLMNNIQRLGNCSAAALPILLAEASREGRIQPGQLVSLTAFGSGFTWGSAVVRWG